MGLKVISYAIFGDSVGYYVPLPALVRSHVTLYPDFQLRIHLDRDPKDVYYGETLLHLEKEGILKVVTVNRPVLRTQSMLWRMLPIWDPEVDYVFTRDIDSIQTPRERKAVEEFLRTGAFAHGINDNPAHDIPLMGGMSGFKAKEFVRTTGLNSFDQMIGVMSFSDGQWKTHGTDQILLNEYIWPRVRSSACIHKLRGGGGYGNNPSWTFNAVPNIELSWVKSEILNKVDSFTNYIGACQLEVDIADIIDIYDKYGSDKVEIVKRAEIETELDPKGYSSNSMPALIDKKVLFSTDNNPFNFFLMPIASLVWRKFAKYHPMICIVGDESEWQSDAKRRIALDFTKEITQSINFVPRVPGFTDEHLAQMTRLYACCLSLPDTTYVLTSSVDMIPLSTTWFHQQNYNKDLHIFFANAYRHEKYPICYCGANINTWRRIMKVGEGSIHAALTYQLNAGPGPDAPAEIMNTYDELLISLRIREWPGYPNQCHMIDRATGPNGLPDGRLDRVNWQPHGFNNQLIDCRPVQPAYILEHWQKIVEILRAILTPKDLLRCVNYRDQFANAI
jgi:hypothetical protein